MRPRPPAELPPWQVGFFGFCGGVLDAIGGGWGAVVTSTLIGRGGVPRTAIGSASLEEFFVTTAISATFVVAIGVSLWPVILAQLGHQFRESRSGPAAYAAAAA